MPHTERPLRQTDRSTVKRLANRASFDRALAYRIIDEAYICHAGFAVEGRPWVIPTIHARVDDRLYLHGAPANHLLRSMTSGVEACVTITILDGLVVARSAFHHSMNYRSIVLFGLASKVDDEDEKRTALDALVEHVIPGRGTESRPPNDSELRSTLVIRLPIAEGSVKMRTGGPVDDEADIGLAVWAGVVPLRMVAGEPVADGLLASDLAAHTPDHVRTAGRPGAASDVFLGRV